MRAHAGPARDVVHNSGKVLVAHGHDSEPSGSVEGHSSNPCALVTAQQVAAVIRQPVTRAVEAKLGPTCVYVPQATSARNQVSHGHAKAHGVEVTLAITPMNFKNSVGRLSTATAFSVSGHRGYCGVIGHPVAYVSLTYGRVMTVVAPCPLAASIAKIALKNL
ncbi:MAG TPA: hypothetical protein VG294_03015 [Solirubrobacteraceae bacterium]|jgi:hypothetical protein|nr:hypothetical protein [Solirubrobacteraceae bacterium]